MKKKFKNQLVVMSAVTALSFSTISSVSASVQTIDPIQTSVQVQPAVATEVPVTPRVYTADEYLAEYATIANSSVVTVEGYIVGTSKDASTAIPFVHGPDFTLNTNIVIAPSPTERNTSKFIVLQLPTAFRAEWSLVDKKENLFKKIRFTGKKENYFSTYKGVKNTTEIVAVSADQGVVIPTANVAPGEVDSGKVLTLSTTTQNAIIRYTTHNTKPTDQSPAFPSEGLAITQNTTVRAIAFSNGKESAEFTGTYTIRQVNPNVVALPTASVPSGSVTAGQKVELSSTTTEATIYYTLDGSTPTEASTKYTAPVAITQDTTLKAIAVKQGLTTSGVATFTYTIAPATKNVTIMDIQGAAHTSPYLNKQVTDVQGVVTYVYADKKKFVIQDKQGDNNLKTSDGVAVYASDGHTLQIGDEVKVSGVVEEFVGSGRGGTDLTETQIKPSNITKVSSNVTLPQSILIGEGGRMPVSGGIDNDNLTSFDPEEDAIDFMESLEGMRITLKTPKIVGPQKFGELNAIVETGTPNPDITTSGTVRISENDFNPERFFIKPLQNYEVTAGDRIKHDVTGIVTYSFGNFKVFTADPIDIEKGNVSAESTTLEAATKKLTAATFNVENYSAASPAAKTQGIAQAIVKNLKSPDVVALMEMQDNNGEATGNTAANETFKTLIDAIKAAGGPEYRYAQIDPVNNQDGGAPNANIRNGFLYNPQRVSLKEGSQAGNSTTAVDYVNGSLTLNPGRVSPTDFDGTRKPLAAQFVFEGKDVIFIANHLSSKGGDEPLFGKNQPANRPSEVQRHKQATALNAFVKKVMTANSAANVVVLGDMNDFEFSETLRIVKGNELDNMIEFVPEKERFGYVYEGNAQVLDHILVSKNLTAITEIDMVHMNSPFSLATRISDHDPSVIRIDFNEKITKGPTITFNNKVNVKRLVLNRIGATYNFAADVKVSDAIVVKAPCKLRGEGLKDKKIIIDLKNATDVVDLTGVVLDQAPVIKNGKVKR
ncbi:MAG: chitobiase/beta-hexosaminidase C-terminal domain-containing protein [Bacilli bacterium]